jgi:hypothetical protein
MSDAPAPPSLPQLFLGFLSIGMYGFGGVLPWARRIAVEKKRWLSATADYAAALADYIDEGHVPLEPGEDIPPPFDENANG